MFCIFAFSKIQDSLRYFLEISYNGGAYHGWQMQPDVLSVQEVVQNRLSVSLQQPIEVVGAGRTDAGVHAKQMFMHFDSDKELVDLPKIAFRLNAFLPRDIASHSLVRVPNSAHARFDALYREYHYLISLHKDPFSQDFAMDLRSIKLDVDAMRLASEKLLSHTNYECFSRSKTTVKTYECTIVKADWIQENGFLRFEVTANRFLRNMVRAMVGTLIDVGRGRCSQDEFETILHSNNRCKAGTSAPPHGLYLNRIIYPKEIIS